MGNQITTEKVILVSAPICYFVLCTKYLDYVKSLNEEIRKLENEILKKNNHIESLSERLRQSEAIIEEAINITWS